MILIFVQFSGLKDHLRHLRHPRHLQPFQQQLPNKNPGQLRFMASQSQYLTPG